MTTNRGAPGGHVDERVVVWNVGTTGGSSACPADWRRAVRTVRGAELPGRTTRVSLVVVLVDAFTGGRPRGDPAVSLDGVRAEPVRNASGHFVFVDLDATGEVTVTVDGGAYYADPDDATASLPAEGAELPDPVVVQLVPASVYPFPLGTTLIRGRVVDDRSGDVARIADARVSVDGLGRVTQTAANGEYVVCFGGTNAAAAVREGEEWVVRVDGADPTVTADVEGLGERSVVQPVPAGQTTVRDIVYE